MHRPEAGRRLGMADPSGQRERVGPTGTLEAGDDRVAVGVEVVGAAARIELGQVRLPGGSGPQRRHGHSEQDALDRADLAVTDERSDQDQPAHQVGTLGGRPHRRARAHRVADDDGALRACAELLDQGDQVGAGGRVAVPAEGRVAVAVAPQVGAGDAVAGGDEGRHEVPVGRAEVAHPGDEDHEGTVSGHVVADAPLGAAEVLEGAGSGVVGHVANILSHAASVKQRPACLWDDRACPQNSFPPARSASPTAAV